MNVHWFFKTALFKLIAISAGMYALAALLYQYPTWQEFAQCAGAKATIMDHESTEHFIDMAKLEINYNNLQVSAEEFISEMDKAFYLIMEAKTPEDKSDIHNNFMDNCM